MAGWTHPLGLLQAELTQRRDERCDIPDDLAGTITAVPDESAWDAEVIDPLFERLIELPIDAELAAAEPNDLAAIRALRSDGPRDFDWQPDEHTLIDRMHGAWLGRASGCALGKPVEAMGMTVEAGQNVGRQRIRDYLQRRNAWPLDDYIPGGSAADGVELPCAASHRENIAYAEADDDLHYSLVGLGVLEAHGPEFDWHDVARYWLSHIPPLYICTAELQAIINYQSCEIVRDEQRGIATPDFTRTHRNPYREWIGAQIRADPWAWACAGRPELAAELAWRDAHWTHTRNGIYGEMFVAAMIAAAFVERDPRRLVDIGLSEIPADCRLARWVRESLEWIDASDDVHQFMEKLEASGIGNMNPVHTINNACIVVAAIHFGEMDERRALCAAVTCGLDTDCNGATVGSIVGASLGASNIRGDLSDRLNDTIKPNMLGFQETRMRDLARRTATVWDRVMNR